MPEDATGQGQLRAHQESRPINSMKTHDIFPDDMGDIAALRPIMGEPFLVVRIAAAGQIIGERIHPHIHHMAVATRHLDAPVEAGARDAKVRQAALDKAQHLVAAAFGLDEIRIFSIEAQQRLLIAGKAEEPAFLDIPFHRRALRGELHAPFPFGQFLLIVKGLVADRIPAFIAVEIEVAIIRHRLPDRLAGLVMIGLRRADETIIGNIQPVIHILEIG